MFTFEREKTVLIRGSRCSEKKAPPPTKKSGFFAPASSYILTRVKKGSSSSKKKSGFFAPASSYILTRVRLALSHLKFFAEKRDGRRFVIIWCGTSLFTEPCVWSTVCFELLISIKLEFFKYFEFTVISSIERVFVLLLLRREEPRTQFYASSSTCRLSSYVAISDL